MTIVRTSSAVALALASAVTLALASGVSHAQGAASTDNSETQLAKFGGAMHLTASKCGGYSEDQLNELKSQQKQTLAQNGMDGDSFEQAYAAGMKEAEARWEGLSEAEQKKTCDEVRDQSNQMTE